jgi:hypothetical protein
MTFTHTSITFDRCLTQITWTPVVGSWHDFRLNSYLELKPEQMFAQIIRSVPSGGV